MAIVITWDEISGEAKTHEIPLNPDDDHKVWDKAIQIALGHEEDEEDPTWKHVEMISTRWGTQKITLMIISSERGHIATNQILWDRGTA